LFWVINEEEEIGSECLAKDQERMKSAADADDEGDLKTIN
jgi:hypothetical protein